MTLLGQRTNPLMLGNAAAQPFDYSPYMRQDAPAQPATAPKRGRGMFGNGRMIAGLVGDYISRLSGQQGMFLPMMQQRQEREQAMADAERQRMQPQRMSVGGNFVEYDPSTGQTRTLYQAPRDPQTFEDNSGNRWQMGPDGQTRMVFYDPTPRFDSNVTVNDRGEQVLVRTPRPNGFNPDGTARDGSPGGIQPGAIVRDPRRMTPDSAAPVLSSAATSQTITPADAARIRQSLGPNGQAAFERWLRTNNITIGGR